MKQRRGRAGDFSVFEESQIGDKEEEQVNKETPTWERRSVSGVTLGEY